jgi:hypothetical protein
MEKTKRAKKYSRVVTCVRGHTAPFVEVFLSDPKYRIWAFVCETCGTGVFWSGGKDEHEIGSGS